MLAPPIDSLMQKINSKYSLVTVAAKRARQLQYEDQKLLNDDYISEKFVGMALEEIDSGKLTMEK
ncbi:DNA-directed RNA polymerase subunit omega [Bacillus fonticola]|uniref:DNA-directed RNA polymerase subunit omega n=1 Tax=Bacillus fonticola TaxID=2728853 RepID=UPI001475DC53|nr:DNA-directed RNA polymerase subunit omega [Bacillus fonticola]